MKPATPSGPPPEGMIRVQVFIRAEGHVDMFMTKDELDEHFPDGDFPSADAADVVLDAAGTDIVNAMEWSVEDVHEVKRRAATKEAGE